MSRVGASRWVKAAVLILIGVVAAWSWLFFVSKWGPARRIDILTFKAGLTSKVMRTLLQPAFSADGAHSHSSAMLSGIYATPEYFAMTEQAQEAAKYIPEKFNVFFLFEDIHIGELSESVPHLMLRLDDGRQFSPVDTDLIRDSSHHRASVVRFPASDRDGTPLMAGKTSSFQLVAHDMAAHSEQVMEWELPIVYPNDLTEGTLSFPTLIALLAGLLAVLSPCLLQLTVYYTFALAGVSMQQGADPSLARGRVVRTALYFMAGFTLVFTAAGALAGVAGERLQDSRILEDWNHPLAIAAGLGILLVGVWVGVNAGAPGFCRLPRVAALGQGSRHRWLEPAKMMFMGSAFAVGCSTCFGGALFISLMIYVGSVGSASVGALALFLFSVGIAIPYLVSAFFLSRALPLLGSFQRAASGIGLVCSVVLIFFGMILITDNFHIPSNLLYRAYLGL
jgi:cytochrome c-type biogenesis protein